MNETFRDWWWGLRHRPGDTLVELWWKLRGLRHRRCFRIMQKRPEYRTPAMVAKACPRCQDRMIREEFRLRDH